MRTTIIHTDGLRWTVDAPRYRFFRHTPFTVRYTTRHTVCVWSFPHHHGMHGAALFCSHSASAFSLALFRNWSLGVWHSHRTLRTCAIPTANGWRVVRGKVKHSNTTRTLQQNFANKINCTNCASRRCSAKFLHRMHETKHVPVYLLVKVRFTIITCIL